MSTTWLEEVREATRPLVGYRFASQQTLQDPQLERPLKVEVAPEKMVEALARNALAGIPGVRRTFMEPFGRKTFPDVAATRHRGGKLVPFYAEVKSYAKAYLSCGVANVNQYRLALLAGDDKYFTTPYIVFDIIDKGQDYLVNDVLVGNIWDFSNGNAHIGTTKQFSTNRRKGEEAVTPVEFFENSLAYMLVEKDNHQRFYITPEEEETLRALWLPRLEGLTPARA